MSANQARAPSMFLFQQQQVFTRAMLLISTFFISTLCLLIAAPLSQAQTQTDNTVQSTSTLLTQPLLLNDELQAPWGMAFIDSNTLLVTEKMGQIKIIRLHTNDTNSDDMASAQSQSQVEILAQTSALSLFTNSQGGLLDIAISPNFQNDLRIYISYSQLITLKNNNIVAATTLASATLSHNPSAQKNKSELKINAWKTLLTSNVQTKTARHFGSRLSFDDHGHLFISMGDRGNRDNGQDLSTLAGVILRLNLDGSIPADNPFVKTKNAQASIYSYGHRNPQGLIFDINTQQLIASEHGPRGGDEINIIHAGGNYGWPIVSYGKEYWGPVAVGEAQSLPEYIDPVAAYIPSIGTCGITLFNQHLYITGLAKPQISQILFSDLLAANKQHKHQPLETAKTALFTALKQRIRDIETSPDNKLYFITDNGNLYRSEVQVAKP